MKVKFASIISDARGKVGGSIFARNASGAYVRGYVNPVNPRTSLQMAQRTRFGQIAQAWRNLSDGARESWEAARNDWPQQDSLGSTIRLTAFQLFSKLSNNLALVNIPFPEFAPLKGQVEGFISLSVSLLANNNMEMAAELGSLNVVPENSVMLLYGTRVLSRGVTRPKDQDFRFLGYLIQEEDVASRTISEFYDPVFGRPTQNPAGEPPVNFFIKAVIQTASGDRSPEIIARAV